jgi:glycosyltransferase involved in cell wall biosynthesis
MSNKFCFVVPMFDASATLARMLHSVCGQSYEDWRVVLIDDLSSEHERRRCSNVIGSFRTVLGEPSEGLTIGPFGQSKIQVIWSTEKRWEVANVLRGLELCDSGDIVCRLDADDWLTDLDALAIIDAAYRETGCDVLWTAHRWGFSDKNISGPLPEGVDPYAHPWVTSHLKTWRCSLSEGVADENYRGPDGGYIRRAGDQCLYLPVLHKARKRVFLPRVMYHYSICDVPATYQTDDAKFQKAEADFIRARGFIG